MQDETDKQQPDEVTARRTRYFNAATISISAHVLLLLAILIGLPHAEPQQPPKEEVVSVDIVPPPEPPKPEQPKPEAAPPPPPPPAEKPPEEKPQEQAPPIPVLKPVFEYGEKDSGAEKALDGDSATASSEAEQKPDEPQPQEPEKEIPTPEEPKTPPEPEPEPEKQAEKPSDSASELTAPTLAEEGGLKNEKDSAEPTLQAEEAKPQEAKPKPTAPPMEKAKKLYSSKATGEMVAMMAMAGVPRDVRVSQLCATELREQLKHGRPRYDAEYVPDVKLPGGNVMQVERSAFRASGVWYNLRFRCEIDSGATKVLNFSFEVGDRVPKSEWAERRFPRH